MGIIAPDNDKTSENNHKNKIAPNKPQKNRKTSQRNFKQNSGLPGLLIFIALVVIIFFVIIKSATSINSSAKSSTSAAKNQQNYSTTNSESANSSANSINQQNQTGGIQDKEVLNEILTEIGATSDSSENSSSSTSATNSYEKFQNQNFTNRNYTKDKNGLYEFTSCVIDAANLLSDSQYSELCSYLVNLNKTSGVQIAVLTVKSLNGEDIEGFSLSHAEKWGLGQRGVDNGALLAVAYDERAIRIETGYGTEAALTDAKCARIIRNVIAPNFQKGDYGSGIILGVKNMAGIITDDETLVSKDVSEENVKSNGSAIPIIVIMLIFFVFYFRAIIYGITHRGRRGTRVYPRNSNAHRSSSGSGGFSSGSSHSSGSSFRGGGGHFGGGGASGRW